MLVFSLFCVLILALVQINLDLSVWKSQPGFHWWFSTSELAYLTNKWVNLKLNLEKWMSLHEEGRNQITVWNQKSIWFERILLKVQSKIHFKIHMFLKTQILIGAIGIGWWGSWLTKKGNKEEDRRWGRRKRSEFWGWLALISF